MPLLPLTMPIKRLVGLGNPGESYQHTRHNAGVWLVDALAQQAHVLLTTEKKFQGALATYPGGESSCMLLRPSTFMNHNGASVRAVSQFYRLSRAEILIVHDDLDLAPGRLKLKTGGGHGGHNGVRDVIAQLGGADFHRLRIGIGHPGHKTLVHDYVLSTPALADNQAILAGIQRILPHMSAVFAGQFEKVTSFLARDKDEHGI